jgi:hypothetical protein
MCIAFNRYKKSPQRPLPRSKVQSTHLTNDDLHNESTGGVHQIDRRRRNVDEAENHLWLADRIGV